jgi:hypothetical protein
MLDLTARRLETPPPAPGPEGDFAFELADGFRLLLREWPGGDGGLAWTEAVPPAAGGAAEAEERAAKFLRLRLARLRRSASLTAARNRDGGLILHMRLKPETESECLEGLSRLLNEAEALRRLLDAGGAAPSAPSGGAFGLFSGRGGMLSGRR